MPIYEKFNATLGAFNGTGFAFVEKPREDPDPQGIFITTEKDILDLEPGSGLPYSGIVHYPKSSKKETFEVEINKVTDVPIGYRVDFVIAREPAESK